MQTRSKRINATFNTLFNKIIGKIINFSNNKQITKSMDKIIIPGHYQTKSSLGSDKIEMIRVLGPDTTKEGYWLIADETKANKKKSISEYTLYEDYVLLDTAYSADVVRKSPPKNIFAGLDDESNSEIIEEPTHAQPLSETIVNSSISSGVANILTPINPQQHGIKADNFLSSFVDKINIVKLNEKNLAKKGEKKYPDSYVLPLSINLEHIYDLTKLKSLIEFLDLDEDEISDYIVDLILQENLRNIKTEIKNQILNSKENLINSSKNVPKNTFNVSIDPKPQIEIKLNSTGTANLTKIPNLLTEIDSIESYINSLTK